MEKKNCSLKKRADLSWETCPKPVFLTPLQLSRSRENISVCFSAEEKSKLFLIFCFWKEKSISWYSEETEGCQRCRFMLDASVVADVVAAAAVTAASVSLIICKVVRFFGSTYNRVDQLGSIRSKLSIKWYHLSKNNIGFFNSTVWKLCCTLELMYAPYKRRSFKYFLS